MARNYRKLKEIVENNKNKIAEFDSYIQTLTFENVDRIYFAHQQDAGEQTEFLFAKNFKGLISSLKLREERIDEGGGEWHCLTDLEINGRIVFTWKVSCQGPYSDIITYDISSYLTLESILEKNKGLVAKYNTKHYHLEFSNEDKIYFHRRHGFYEVYYKPYCQFPFLKDDCTRYAMEEINNPFEGIVTNLELKRETSHLNTIQIYLIINNVIHGLWHLYDPLDCVRWSFREHKFSY